MVIRVEGFWAEDMVSLQAQINDWLKNNPNAEYVDLRHSSAVVGDSIQGDLWQYTAILVYRTKNA